LPIRALSSRGQAGVGPEGKEITYGTAMAKELSSEERFSEEPGGNGISVQKDFESNRI
jgi:hypothetical protein